MSNTRQQHPTIIKLKTGVKKEGIILAVKCKNIADEGTYTSSGSFVI